MYSQSCPARRTIHLKIMTAAFLLFFCMLPSTMQGQARWGTPFLRHPAPSPDGSRIALSCGGDIWIVSGTGVTARRITIHEAYDAHPVWSPAGDLIAFTSNRLGKNNIFVVDTLGMAVTQLTFRGAGDRPVDWSADGSDVVFTSLRDFSPRRIPTPYRVPSDGSRMPSKLWPVLASDVRVSPEGDKIAFSQGYQRWWRKGYTGSGNFDLWLYLPHSDSYRRLTGLAASEHTPMWPAGGPFIYYVSEHSGTANIYRRALEAPPTEPGEAVTFFTEDGVRWARISAGGNLIAFERGTDIFTLSLDPGAEPQLLRVALPADIRRNTLEWKSFSKGAESFSVSPDGSQAAVVVRGELFCVENLDDGYTNRIAEQGKETSRESAPRWLPDSTRLLFVSDRAGSAEDVYLVESADTSRKKLYQCLEFKLTRLTDGKMREHSPVPSPDGRTIAYIRGNGDLMLMNADGTDKRPLVTGWNMDHICWSPDSRWIAFSRNDIEFNQDVWLVAADRSREPVNVSMHPDIDNSPMFSADGRKLAFLSRRNHDNLDLYFVFLRRTDHELSVQERRWRAEEEAEKEKKKKGEKHEPSAIVIDFTDIHKRLRRVTSLTTDVQGFTLSPDGKTFAFSADMDGNSDLYKISWEGKDLTRLTTGGQGPGQLEYSPDGKKIYYLGKGGVPSELTVSSKKTRSLPLSARIRIDYRAERVHVFEEAWRTLNDNFYDPAFHGADWPAMREKYLPAMSSEKNFCAREDFDDLVRLMIGELNASHLGISPPGDGLPDVPVGALGVLLDESYPGPGFKVERVLKNGPADRPESRLYPNDVIVAVEGRQVQPGDNLFHLLYDKVDRQVSLEVRSREKGARIKKLVIRPISSGAQRNLVYDEWIIKRRAMVDSLSGGKLAYLHIRAMSWTSFEQFEQELYSEAHDKKGLIVDVRNNGGGWITDYLMAVLTVRRHAYTIPRGAETSGYPQTRLPVYSWVKPVAALCNELSFSNAEIFSHAFKTLGLGPLVGRTTGGAVISTGATRLIDGSTFRVPFRGWYVRGTDLNMERQGCTPDIIVTEPPGEEGSSRDRQLERAVEELLKSIE